MKNFNLRKFLVENKLTTQSKLISEDKYKRWSEINKDEFPEGTEFYNSNYGQKHAKLPDGQWVYISGPRNGDE